MINPSVGGFLSAKVDPIKNRRYKSFTITGGIGTIPADGVHSPVSVTVLGISRNNLTKSSGMNVDSNADGVVDDFISGNTASAILTLNDNAQKISINACAINNSIAFVRQGSLGDVVNTPCMAGEIISTRVECKYIKTAGSPLARLSLTFRDSAGATIITYSAADIVTTTNGFIEVKIENKVAPALTAYVSISAILQVSATASTTPETADVWFKNAMLEKAATVGNYITSGVNSTVSGTIQVKDPDGVVKSAAFYNGTLRSVGSANDEVRVSGGKAEHIQRNNKITLDIASASKFTTNDPLGYDAYRISGLWTTKAYLKGKWTAFANSTILEVGGIPLNWIGGTWLSISNENQYVQYVNEGQGDGIDLLAPTGIPLTTYYASKPLTLTYQLLNPDVRKKNIYIEYGITNPITAKAGDTIIWTPTGDPTDTTTPEIIVEYGV